MNKRSSLIIILVLLLVGVLSYGEIVKPTANIYIENNTVTCDVTSFFGDNRDLEEDICNYVLSELNNYDPDVDSVKSGIEKIANGYGISKININLDSEVGDNKLSEVFQVQGNSMNPTLESGQSVVVEKTKDIHVGDIVVANSSQYGVIVKRVSQIDGNQVYLVSDNKKISYKEVNGLVYESKGITTWVDIRDIYGVVKSY